MIEHNANILESVPTMTANLKDASLSASMPSSTSPLSLYNFPVPSFPGLYNGKPATWVYTTAAIIVGLLVLEQTVYRYKKRHLPGDKWTIPIIGKFADSMSPSMEGYQKQWNSGALSAISVFNMYVAPTILVSTAFKYPFSSFIVMASSNEFSRKILNSPSYAEPCIVHAAKQILRPENWCVQIPLYYRGLSNSVIQGFLDRQGASCLPSWPQQPFHSQGSRVQ